MKRSVCVVTGSRAEYGLLRPLLQEIRSSDRLRLQLLVTGMHLSSDFGLTYKAIEEDGFSIDEKVETLISSDTPIGIAKSAGLGLIGISEALGSRLRPDLVVLLGDRYECFSAAAAAMICRIPLAHLHGGEVTEGAIDEAFRHSITKMSQLHFTSAEAYRKRVIQLGECPAAVFNVGAIGLDNLRSIKRLTRKELSREFGIQFAKRNFLVTFHPETMQTEEESISHFSELLAALDQSGDDSLHIFTKANADAGGRAINQAIDRFVANHLSSALAFTSLGQTGYLSLLYQVDAVLGNSSSGLIEAPAAKVVTVNIGDRQKGRIRASTVIDCPARRNDILRALHKAGTAQFKARLQYAVNPYGDGHTALRVRRIIEDALCKGTISVRKKFNDVPHTDHKHLGR